MKLGRYLIGLAAAGLLTLISGCATYNTELAKFLPDEKPARIVHKESELEKKAKKAEAEAEKAEDAEKKVEKKTEKKATKEEKRAELDAQDDDAFNFFRVRNTKSPLNAFLGLGVCGTWDDESHQEGYAFDLPQIKLLGKFGPEKAGRGLLEFALTQQIDHGDPEDHESKDLTFRLSDIIGGFGWHFGDKGLMGYAELRLGAEYLDFDGPLNAYAKDMLIGAKGKLISDSLDAKVLVSLMASTGLLGGMGEFKGRVGDAEIPIEGTYGRAMAKAKIVKKLTPDLYANAKITFDRKHFAEYMTIDNYLGSVGIEGRIKVAGRPVSGSVDLFARRKSKDYAGGKPDEAWNEYGAMARVNLDIGRGTYLTLFAEYTQPFDHGAQSGEFKAGVMVRTIFADLLGLDE